MGKLLQEVLDTYKDAVFTKNIDAFIALYDEDVRVFDMWGEWSYNGIVAWRGMVADWFGSLGSERVVVDMNDVQEMVTHDVAVLHSFVTYKGVSAEGADLRAMQNRLTWVLKQRDGGWKIVHEHTSAPIDFTTSKVILQRG
ncbi:MAG: nuclear transport factor 2 family protein [Ardenticatenaceae bacterium]|nr:nuclear transport factor 2 family protein [Ardenticatenaceae bacterium]